MSSKIRETQVDRDVDGNVIGYTDHIEEPKRGGGGFGLGLLFGVVVIAGALMAFAYSQGSFQTAGARADQATQTAQAEINQSADTASNAVQNATDGNPNTNATDATTN